jgi:GWxTD domain-containing protein
VPVFQARTRTRPDSLPTLITNPRSTVTFGRDTALPVYLEAYGPESRAVVRLAVRGERGEALWSDSLLLERSGALLAGMARVPAAPLGIGIATLSVWRTGRAGADTVRMPVVVSFGDNIAIASFDEMLSYLRYFASPERLKALRDTAPERRGAAWAAFLRETDPVLSTPEHEGLRDYFARLDQANERFREEGLPGWLTDRGMVYITLGEPDRVLEQGVTDLSQRGRTMVWEYLQYRLQLIFVDQTGFGRWKLTLGSEADFNDVARRVRNH